MEEKEIAERLREILDADDELFVAKNSIQKLIDELDPPKPASGTVVWWRENEGQAEWQIGMVASGTHVLAVDGEYINYFDLESIQWEPARIIVDDEVEVKILPENEWPLNADAIDLRH